jgi:hypothetical protein
MEINDPAAAQTMSAECDGQVEVVGDDVIADPLAMWMATPATAGLLGELLSSNVSGSRCAICPSRWGGRSAPSLARSNKCARSASRERTARPASPRPEMLWFVRCRSHVPTGAAYGDRLELDRPRAAR